METGLTIDLWLLAIPRRAVFECWLRTSFPGIRPEKRQCFNEKSNGYCEID
jgi:hypothetical protein